MAERVGRSNGERDLTAEAYHRIRAMILHQDLRPGERTSIAQLAASTGLGRAPVSGAIDRLAAEGLLHVRDRSGTYVAKLGRFELQRLFEMREIYESAAAARVAERITEEQIQGLRALLPQLSTSTADEQGAGRVVRFIDADVEFHKRIIEATDNPYLLNSYMSLNLHLLISHYLVLEGGAHSDARHAEHVAIAQAIERRDEEAISDALLGHSRAVRDAILSTMERLESVRHGT